MYTRKENARALALAQVSSIPCTHAHTQHTRACKSVKMQMFPSSLASCLTHKLRCSAPPLNSVTCSLSPPLYCLSDRLARERVSKRVCVCVCVCVCSAAANPLLLYISGFVGAVCLARLPRRQTPQASFRATLLALAVFMMASSGERGREPAGEERERVRARYWEIEGKCQTWISLIGSCFCILFCTVFSIPFPQFFAPYLYSVYQQPLTFSGFATLPSSSSYFSAVFSQRCEVVQVQTDALLWLNKATQVTFS